MSERTYFTLVLDGDSTPDQRRAVNGVLVDHFSASCDHDDLLADDDGDDGDRATIGDIRCGTLDEHFAKVVETGVSFTAWEDPKHEWLGSVVMHDAATDRTWRGECDGEGNPVFSGSAIVVALVTAGFTDAAETLVATQFLPFDTEIPAT